MSGKLIHVTAAAGGYLVHAMKDDGAEKAPHRRALNIRYGRALCGYRSRSWWRIVEAPEKEGRWQCEGCLRKAAAHG